MDERLQFALRWLSARKISFFFPISLCSVAHQNRWAQRAEPQKHSTVTPSSLSVLWHPHRTPGELFGGRIRAVLVGSVLCFSLLAVWGCCAALEWPAPASSRPPVEIKEREGGMQWAPGVRSSGGTCSASSTCLAPCSCSSFPNSSSGGRARWRTGFKKEWRYPGKMEKDVLQKHGVTGKGKMV